jgi:hypothetical protein
VAVRNWTALGQREHRPQQPDPSKYGTAGLDRLFVRRGLVGGGVILGWAYRASANSCGPRTET